MKRYIETYRPGNILLTLMVLLGSLLAPQQLPAEDMEVITLTVTALPGQKTRVLLLWSERPELDGINIYRKTALLENYPRSPLNPEPISLLTDCDQIRTLIPKSSQEWQILSRLPWPAFRPKGDPGSFHTPPGFIRPAGFDPCQLATLQPGSDLWEEVQFLARRFNNIAMILGQAFLDTNVNSGTSYWYEIRGWQDGEQTILASDIRITAGVHVPLPAPANLQVTAGDSEVLITWDSVEGATGYDVYRTQLPGGTPVKINDAPVMSVINQDLDEDPIAETMGLIDYRRWNEAGYPVTHEVNGIPVAGPVNGISYKYQVRALDALEQPGNLSGLSATVTPTDQTPPGLPGDLKVEAVGQTLRITWSKVTRDQLGRMEMDGILGYNIYRSATQSDPTPLQLNTSLLPQPAVTEVEFIDSSAEIISYYGEKEFYYRIDCTDIHGNRGVLSSTASGHVPDIYAPAIPVYVTAEGYQDNIRLLWELNTEPDIYSYEIYRSLCHLGEWLDPREQDKRELSSGDFVLIGELLHLEAVELAYISGLAYYEDYTVPVGSPLCYAYWVKARDNSQNLSGSWPYPSTAEKKEIVCQRLRDETPPQPPIITAVQARDRSIYLEWIAAPSQDLGAFHVYQSVQEDNGYTWVGGMTVEEPPTPPTDLTTPFAPATPCGCDEIPLVAHAGMNAGSFLHKDIDPKTIFWYKVTSVDQNGNESKLAESIPYSTFTFQLDGPQMPAITTIASSADSCGLILKWTPGFDPVKHLGFMVFRSPVEHGLYRQLSGFLTQNEYTDATIHKDITYWYKVQAFDLQGRPSRLSPALSGKYSD